MNYKKFENRKNNNKGIKKPKNRMQKMDYIKITIAIIIFLILTFI